MQGSKEKIFSIPKEKLISARFIVESRWWLKFIKNSMPVLELIYRDKENSEKTLLLEANIKAGKNNNSDLLADKLNSLVQCNK